MRFLSIIAASIFSFMLTEAHAVVQRSQGIGGMARNMMDPVVVFSDFIYTACIVIGGAFVFSSVVKYFEHRRSPMMVTMGTVIFLLVMGLLLLALPFLAYLDSDGIRYTLFR